jgi:DNA-directed RNA polymerase specialized sigma24 family protein
MVVRNRLIDTIRFHQAARRDRRRVRVVNEEIEANEPISRRRGPATRVTSSEQQALFQAALKNFEERERILLRERLECQTAYQALADRLGYPTADAARKAFSTARSRLLVILQRSGVGEIN